jgi:26S proteasome regulatory subunit N7
MAAEDTTTTATATKKPAAGDGKPAVEEDEDPKPVPDMALAQDLYLLELAQSKPEEVPDVAEVKARVLATIKAEKAEPLYTSVCVEKLGWPVDVALQAELKASNEAELAGIEEQLRVATESSGDMEVLDALIAREKFYARIGNKTAALAAADEILAKPKISTGKKIDAVMDKVRLGLFFRDPEATKENLEKAKKLVEDGGDWDRRNRLKVYEALALITARSLKKASELLLDCIATFTCVELATYNQFIFYAVITNLLYLERTKLKKKLVDGPEVIGVLRDLPALGRLLNALYDCDYRAFFHALVEVTPDLVRDRYTAPHVRILVRELRVLVYSQFLESYKSVRLASMAESFGVSVEFLDKELSRFIASGRLSAKIDKVGGVVETSRPDTKNAQYQEVVKEGDLLLNRLSKLARMVDF